jgi:hypothetical protein
MQKDMGITLDDLHSFAAIADDVAFPKGNSNIYLKDSNNLVAIPEFPLKSQKEMEPVSS